MHQQITQKRINFMNSWSRHTRSAQVMTWSWWWETRTQKLAVKQYISQRWASTEYKCKWPQTGWLCRRQSKVRTSCTNGCSPDGHTFNQIDHCLIDGRHFSDVIIVMARRDANIDSHASRYKIESKNMPSQQYKAAKTETFRSRPIGTSHHVTTTSSSLNSKVCTLN
jgi:hypothetical protein